MAKIKVGIAGCLGRMGQELIKQILNDKNFIFVGGFEHKSHTLIGKSISDVTDIKSSKTLPVNKKSKKNRFMKNDGTTTLVYKTTYTGLWRPAATPKEHVKLLILKSFLFN